MLDWKEIYNRMNLTNRNAMYRLMTHSLRCARLRLPPPVSFALKTAAITFALLAIFPLHPASMVAALGGGLSFSLLIHLI